MFTFFFNILGIVLNRRNILIPLVLVGIIIPLSGIYVHITQQSECEFSTFFVDSNFLILSLLISNKKIISNFKVITRLIFKFIPIFFVLVEFLVFLSRFYQMKIYLTLFFLVSFCICFMMSGILLNRTFILLVIKQNKLVRLFYLKGLIKHRILKKKFKHSLKEIVIFYEKYSNLLLLFLITISYFIGSYFVLFFFSLRVLYTSVLNLEYFRDFKTTRQEDIEKFNYHWRCDLDLIFMNKILFYSKVLGFLVTLFSYFVNLEVLGELGSNYPLITFNYSFSLNQLQYFLSINLFGPIVLLLCIIVRLFLNLHVIHFRNPWTFFKGVATIVTSVEAGIAMAALSSVTVGTYKLSSDYDSGPRINNRVKNTWDFHVQGVVRHSTEDETMYMLLKKKV